MLKYPFDQIYGNVTYVIAALDVLIHKTTIVITLSGIVVHFMAYNGKLGGLKCILSATKSVFFI